LRFVIDEGPRYDVSGVSFIGSQKYSPQDLEQLLELRPKDGVEPKFNSVAMKTDVKALRELYGSQGHVFADIEVEPRFLDEPGKIELVYLITEGQQYRVGKINVHIEGDAGITKTSVILNRLELKPGEIISSSEIEMSQAQLLRSNVFGGTSPGSGQPPRIAVNPKELQDLKRLAESESDLR
jgi:outer membrane protein insertion porin family